jgi:DNA-binding MarR family transcriptional regulator
MVASTAGVRLEEAAHSLFAVITQFCLLAPRGRRRSGDLKEVEFLTLTLLGPKRSMIVGEIQRLLGVLPAQMSRIIRSLEDRERPLITCRINPQDKRKIDVCLTAAGEKALLDYKHPRVHGIADLLGRLSDDDLEELCRLVEKLHQALEHSERSVAAS